MKFGKPNMKTSAKAAVSVVGVGTGVALGRGANDMYPEKKQNSGIAKIATAAAALAAIAFIQSDDMLSCGIKSVAAGFGGEKIISGVSDLLVDNNVLTPKADDSEATKFLQRSLDIEIPCLCPKAIVTTEDQASGRLPSLNMAYLDNYLFQEEQPLEAKPMFV